MIHTPATDTLSWNARYANLKWVGARRFRPVHVRKQQQFLGINAAIDEVQESHR
ncbi:MAG: hypothetical protein JWR35_3786 [Marmoricola sp.]|nr:hypothetical protein [Marmoricola sp.]